MRPSQFLIPTGVLAGLVAAVVITRGAGAASDPDAHSGLHAEFTWNELADALQDAAPGARARRDRPAAPSPAASDAPTSLDDLVDAVLRDLERRDVDLDDVLDELDDVLDELEDLEASASLLTALVSELDGTIEIRLHDGSVRVSGLRRRR